MILLDSDVLIDLLREYPPAMARFDALQDDGRRGRGRPLRAATLAGAMWHGEPKAPAYRVTEEVTRGAISGCASRAS